MRYRSAILAVVISMSVIASAHADDWPRKVIEGTAGLGVGGARVRSDPYAAGSSGWGYATTFAGGWRVGESTYLGFELDGLIGGGEHTTSRTSAIPEDGRRLLYMFSLGPRLQLHPIADPRLTIGIGLPVTAVLLDQPRLADSLHERLFGVQVSVDVGWTWSVSHTIRLGLGLRGSYAPLMTGFTTLEDPKTQNTSQQDVSGSAWQTALLFVFAYDTH